MANNRRDVELNIRATDQTGPGIKKAESALQRFAAAQRATQARRDLYANTEKSARELAAAGNEAADKVALLGKRLSEAKRPSAQLKNDFAEARAEVRRYKDEFLATVVAAGRMNGRIASQPGSFAQFERTVEALRSEAMAADAAGDAINQLSRDLPKAEAAQRRLANATTAATGSLRSQGAGGDTGVSGRIVDAYTSKSGRGPLGLRPYEVQNLGYQINDLITQIGSGTPVMQAFAQQGGQIAQIFPAASMGIIRFIPLVGLATLALSPFISAMQKVDDHSDSLKEFDLLLTRSGERASYNAAKLADLAAKLDAYGGSLDDARAALAIFVGDSVAPAYMERFGKTAIDVAKVLKIDVAEAAEKVSSAFTGNADAVLALDDELNFLTDSERKQIEALRESKKDAEARTMAFDIFAQRYGETAEKMRGPWSTILSNFGRSWSAFVNYVNFIDFSKVKAEINGLMGLLVRLSAMLPGARSGTMEALTQRRGVIDRNIAATEAALARNPGNMPSFGGPSRRQLQDQLNRLQRDRFSVGYDIAKLTNDAAARANPVRPPDTTLDPPKPANTSSSPRPRTGKTDEERRADAQKEFNEDLEAANAKRRTELELLGETERQTEILNAVETARARAADAGLEFTDAQALSIADSVGALYDAKVAQDAFNRVSATARDLAAQRGEIETRDAFIARNLAEEQLTAEMALYAVRADQLGQIYDFDQRARDRTASEKSVNDLLTQQAELQNQINFARESGDESAALTLQAELDGVNARLLQAVNNSIAFWQALGGPESAAAILRLQGLRARLEAVGHNTVVTGKQINDMIAQGGSQAFDQFAQRVADGENVIKSFGRAFLQMAADFLREIARMIVQTALLNAIGGGTGTPNGGVGGVVSGWVNGLFRHNGGLVGQGGGFSLVDARAMLGAVPYHTGGIAGMKPDEVSAVLKRNEEVLTEDDPRHRNNLAKGGGSKSGVKVVNVFEPVDLLDKALGGDDGARVFFNFVRNNQAAFKAYLG